MEVLLGLSVIQWFRMFGNTIVDFGRIEEFQYVPISFVQIPNFQTCSLGAKHFGWEFVLSDCQARVDYGGLTWAIKTEDTA